MIGNDSCTYTRKVIYNQVVILLIKNKNIGTLINKKLLKFIDIS